MGVCPYVSSGTHVTHGATLIPERQSLHFAGCACRNAFRWRSASVQSTGWCLGANVTPSMDDMCVSRYIMAIYGFAPAVHCQLVWALAQIGECSFEYLAFLRLSSQLYLFGLNITYI